MIDAMRTRGYSLRAIGAVLRRSLGTICRELRPNRGPDSLYDPYWANVYYWGRRKRCVARAVPSRVVGIFVYNLVMLCTPVGRGRNYVWYAKSRVLGGGRVIHDSMRDFLV